MSGLKLKLKLISVQSTELDTFFVKEVARISTENDVEITKRNAMFKLSENRAYRFDYNSYRY